MIGIIVRVHDDAPRAGTKIKDIAAIPDETPVLPPGILDFTKRLSLVQAAAWGALLGLALPPDPAPPYKRRPAAPPKGETDDGQMDLGLETTAAVSAAASEIGRLAGRKEHAAFLAWGGEGACRALIAEATRATLERSRNVLILLPDVARSGDFRARIQSLLGTSPAVFHGGLSPRAQAEEWAKVRRGEARIILGSRAALFKPWPDIGLIVVEDESDDSHIQTESSAYDVRRGALFRAEAEKAVALSTAAAPSVEAYARSRDDGTLRTLGGREAEVPVRISDEAKDKAAVSRTLREGLAECLAARGRAIVFLNRRGYASMLFCPACGYIPRCGRCGSVFSYHKKKDLLSCHACGAEDKRPNACPSCGRRILEPRGGGVEAIEEELTALFPRARTALFDKDQAGRAVDREKILTAWIGGRIDILIGTQMLARRIDLPRADFVGIFNPEAGLAFPEFTASERTFQTLRRMIRFARPDGKRRLGAAVQTGFPDHHSIRTAARGDYEAFFAEEIEIRRLLRQPPFIASAEIILRDADVRRLGRVSRALAGRWKAANPAVRVLGPSFAAEPGRPGLKRVQLELRADRTQAITDILFDGLKDAGVPFSVTRHDGPTAR